MSQRSLELLEFYRRHRIDDQLAFYTRRRELFERATDQALAISAVLLAFSSAVSVFAFTAARGSAEVWSIVGIILPAMSIALAAYTALYAFEQQSKIYGDAARAIRAASRTKPGSSTDLGGRSSDENVAELVRRVEDVLRQEQAQWGQLTSQIQMSNQANAMPEE
jgi:hypothetical protein